MWSNCTIYYTSCFCAFWRKFGCNFTIRKYISEQWRQQATKECCSAPTWKQLSLLHVKPCQLMGCLMTETFLSLSFGRIRTPHFACDFPGNMPCDISLSLMSTTEICGTHVASKTVNILTYGRNERPFLDPVFFELTLIGFLLPLFTCRWPSCMYCTLSLFPARFIIWAWRHFEHCKDN